MSRDEAIECYLLLVRDELDGVVMINGHVYRGHWKEAKEDLLRVIAKEREV